MAAQPVRKEGTEKQFSVINHATGYCIDLSIHEVQLLLLAVNSIGCPMVSTSIREVLESRKLGGAAEER
jgi:hypothetical protein